MVRDGVANVVEQLRRRGFDPRRVGRALWEARCPVHRGRDHALAVSRNEHSHVVLDCRGQERCAHFRIIAALGLTNEHVYAETPEWLIGQLRREPIERATFGSLDGPDDLLESGVLAMVEPKNPPEGGIRTVRPFAEAAIVGLGGQKQPLESRLEAASQPMITAKGEFPIDSSMAPTSIGAELDLPGAFTPAIIVSSTRLERDGAVQILARLASTARLFRSADGHYCAQVPVGSRLEIFSLKSAGLRDWLIDGYLGHEPEPPSSWALRRVIGMLEARARFNTGIPDVFVRVGQEAASTDAPYFLDLGDASGRAVAIDDGGWDIVDRPTLCFRRPEGLLPLPAPARGGSIDLVRSYVNLNEPDFRLMLAWLTAALRPVGPYPILVLNGEQASGKSTLARILRLLVDPQACPSLSLPKSTHDLMATAVNGWLLMYENISAIPGWLSDSLCQLAFGGGFATRTLFTNDERSLIYAQRPIILVGIHDFVGRPDLRDRSVFLHLNPIPRTQRRTERALWPAFRADHPQILGALLDAIAGGLRELPSVHLNELPRMADFAEWGEATSRALGFAPDTFLTLYDDNRAEATELILDDSPVATALLGMARQGVNWSGKPSDLHDAISKAAGKTVTTSARWPKTAHGFGVELRRIAPQLRLRGLSIDFERRNDGRRVVLQSARAVIQAPPAPAVIVPTATAIAISPSSCHNIQK
jgi:hypothetical protein